MTLRAPWLLVAACLLARPALAQMGPGGPPPRVGVVRADYQPVVESNQFIGRIQAVNRVNLVARVDAVLEQQFFTEGAEVKKGDLLFRLEQPPFQADVQAKQGVVGQMEAQLQNASITLDRAQRLLNTPAGQRSTVDDALAVQRSDAAQVLTAEANLRTSQINLGYTDIRAPVDGKIGQTLVTVGNVVSPGSGTLATIASQDPMYVAFPVSVRTVLDLRQHYAAKGGFDAVTIKLKLPDGRIYDQPGRLDFVNNTVQQNTDTLLLRGVVANPLLPAASAGHPLRELVDGEFVTVILQSVQPVPLLAVPRAAVMSSQQGDFVYTVDAQNRVQQTAVTLGQSTPLEAVVLSGLRRGDRVITDGLQHVKPGLVVQPGPAAPILPPGAPGGANPAPASGPGGGQPGGNAPSKGPAGGVMTPPPGGNPSSRS